MICKTLTNYDVLRKPSSIFFDYSTSELVIFQNGGKTASYLFKTVQPLKIK